MTTLSTVELTATLSGQDALRSATLDATINAATIDEATLARLDGSLDTSLAAALTAPEQILAGFRVYADGVLVPPSQMGPNAFFSETMEGDVAFGFELVEFGDAPDFEAPFGGPLDCVGPPGADKSLDLEMVYLTTGGPRAVRLVTGGRVENSSKAASPAGVVRRVNCVGPLADLVDVEVELSIPPGAGLTPLEQVEAVLAAAGRPGFPRAFPPLPSSRLDRELELRGESALSAIADILRPYGRVFAYSRDGNPEIRVRRPVASTAGVTAWSIGGSRVLLEAGALSEDSDDGAPTEVCIQGTEQVVESVDTEVAVRQGSKITSVTGLGSFRVFWTSARARVRRPVSITEAPFSPEAATHTRDTGCVLTPISNSFTYVEPIEVLRRELVESLDFCTITLERATTYGWYNPEIPSSRTDGAGGFDCLATFVNGDTLRATANVFARFRPIEETFIQRSFDLEGRLVAEQVDRYSWYARRAAISNWDTGTGLYDDWIAGPINLFRDFDGVLAAESFQLTERTLSVFDVTTDNYLTRKTTELSQWAVPPAAFGLDGTRQYGDGRISRDASETFRLVETRTELYEPLPGDASHRQTTVLDREDRPFIETEVTGALEGFLPPARMRDDIIPDPALYPRGRPVCLDSSRLIEGCWTALNLEACRPGRPRRTLRVFDGRVESVDRAREMALAELRDRTAIDVSFPLPVYAPIQPGDLVDLEAPAVGFDYDGLRVVAHEIRQQDGAIVSQLTTELDVL